MREDGTADKNLLRVLAEARTNGSSEVLVRRGLLPPTTRNTSRSGLAFTKLKNSLRDQLTAPFEAGTAARRAPAPVA
jgi:hypothetical protein